MRYLSKAVFAAALVLLPCANAGRIVVNHDEWTFSQAGYAAAGAASTGQFAVNTLNFLSNGAGSDVLVYSNNALLTNTDFNTSANGAGYAVNKTTALTFNLANISSYEVIVLGGFYLNAAELADLVTYVNNGGGVYLAGGSGAGGPAVEAAAWNPFLNQFGFDFAPTYNGIGGTIAVNQTHLIESGVTQLYYDNGNTASLFALNPNATIIETFNGAGILGVFDSTAQGVPEPTTTALLGGGLLALGLLRRLKR